MNPELIYKYNQYQRKERMEEARLERLARSVSRSSIPHRTLLSVANGIIATGQRLQAFALGCTSINRQNAHQSGD